MAVLIDGYNLLRSVQNGTDEFAHITESQMCHFISRFLKRTKDRGKIVFDGIGPPDKTPLENIPALEVIFSGRTLEADDVIEELILENTAPKRLTVVSSDRRIKSGAKKRRARAIGSFEFWLELTRTLEKPNREKPLPPGKTQGITEIETDLWLKEFGLDD